MRVGNEFSIALHALLMIAYFPDIRITSDVVAESAGCNAVIIRNIFTKLKKAGIITVKSGRGGVTLAKPPDDILFWQVFIAVESSESQRIVGFHQNISKTCPVGSQLKDVVVAHIDDAVAAMVKELSDVTIASMLEEIKSLNETNQ